ncbi:speG [Acanthosepion pharaonis]|uniref:SpeG n=1 Tax=Acanthosepion pharaonis TaxID=158019 RepID=A0A812CZ58_ACAPH|nr:speG [Sepia pharaonis]
MTTTEKFIVRPGRVEDCDEVHRLIKELAIYEKMGERVEITPEVLKQHGFGDHKYFHVLVAEISESEDLATGTIGGYLLYFYGYDPWQGKYLYVEDFYVTPECRKIGMGSALWKTVIKTAAKEQCEWMEWCVLDWNHLAINFYKRYGAVNVTKEAGQIFRLTSKEVENVLAKIQ